MDTLADADRARLDREWAMYADVTTPVAPLLAGLWVQSLPPAEQAYIAAKVEALGARLVAIWTQYAGWAGDILAVINSRLEQMWPPPAPRVRARYARAVHRGARRR